MIKLKIRTKVSLIQITLFENTYKFKKVLDSKKDEAPVAKKAGLFSRWGSNNKTKNSSVTPPNSPVPEETTEPAAQGK